MFAAATLVCFFSRSSSSFSDEDEDDDEEEEETVGADLVGLVGDFFVGDATFFVLFLFALGGLSFSASDSELDELLVSRLLMDEDKVATTGVFPFLNDPFEGCS